MSPKPKTNLPISRLLLLYFILLPVFAKAGTLSLDDMLQFVENKDQIKRQVQAAPEIDVKQLKAAIQSGSWCDSVFDNTKIYDLLLKAYSDNSIGYDCFLNAQFYLQSRSEFMGVPEISHYHQNYAEKFLGAGGTVERINLADEKHSQTLTAIIAALNKREDKNFRFKQSQWLQQVITTCQESDKPAWCDIVSLEPELYEQIKKLPNKLTTAKDGLSHVQHNPYGGFDIISYNPSQQKGVWVKTLYCRPAGGIVRLSSGELAILTPGIQEAIAAKQNPEPVKLRATFGSIDHSDLYTMRSGNLHALTLYHPDVNNGLMKPHDVHAGPQGAALHDLYHHSVLNRLPAWQRKIFLAFYQSELALQQALQQHNITLDDPIDTIYPDFKANYVAWEDPSELVSVVKTEATCKWYGMDEQLVTDLKSKVMEMRPRRGGIQWWEDTSAFKPGNSLIQPNFPLLDQEAIDIHPDSKNNDTPSFLSCLFDWAGSYNSPEDIFFLKLYHFFHELKANDPRLFSRLCNKVPPLVKLKEQYQKGITEKVANFLWAQKEQYQKAITTEEVANSHRRNMMFCGKGLLYHELRDKCSMLACKLITALEENTGDQLTAHIRQQLKANNEPELATDKHCRQLAFNIEDKWNGTLLSRALIKKLADLLGHINKMSITAPPPETNWQTYWGTSTR